MIFARGGDNGDGVVTHYDHDRPVGFTPYADALPYLREFVSDFVDTERLNFVRLAKVSNSVGIPHRDLLELGEIPESNRNAHRMHIPLETNEDSFFSEGNTVFRMRQGEVWFLDASKIHSLAVLSPKNRVHMMFDFTDAPSDRLLVTGGGAVGRADAGIPEDRLVHRPVLSPKDREDLMRLADVLSMDTFSEVFSIVIKKHYRYNGGENFVWDTMLAIAQASGDDETRTHAEELRRYFTLERSA